jgi:hypothetical protein
LSALRAGRALPPGTFLVLISVKRPSLPQGHSAAERIRSIEKSNDLIGNRTRDIPACGIVPQPTTLPRTCTPLAPNIPLSTLFPNPLDVRDPGSLPVCCLPTVPPAGTHMASQTAAIRGRGPRRRGPSARLSTLISPPSRAVTLPSPLWRDGRQLTTSTPAPSYRLVCMYCHVLLIRHRVSIDNWIYTLYKSL